MFWRIKVFMLICLAPWINVQAADAPSWTILVYGNGDNNLSAQLVEDLRKMEEVGGTAKFRIVAEVDFDASSAEDNTDSGLPEKLSSGTSRFLMVKSDDEDRLVSPPVERLRELNHDDPQVLADFVEWAIKRYPADRYGIIFWDHGGQWEGFGGDGQDGTEDSPTGISAGKIREALMAAMRKRGVGKFDFIAFDTCLMGGLEVLDNFDGLCDLFIACPEIDYGDGWNYGESLSWLKEHPGAAMAEFGRHEVKSWKKLHMSEENEGDRALAAHCAYDMQRYRQVKQAFSEFTRTLAAELSPNQLFIPKQRRKTVEYSLSLSGDSDDSAQYIDLGQFARRFADDPATPAELKTRGKELADAIAAMVVAKAMGEEKFGALGLSVWYPIRQRPDNDDDEDDDDDEDESAKSCEEARKKFECYKALPLFASSPWAAYLSKVWEYREKFDDDPILSEPGQKKLALFDNQKLELELNVTSGKGAYAIHGAIIDNRKGKNNSVVYLGEVIEREIDGPGRYRVSWDLKILSLPGADGTKIMLGAFPKNDAGDLWLSYADYQRTKTSRPQRVALLIQVKDNKAKVLKMLDADSDSLAPAALKPRPGAILSPVYVVEKRRGKDPDKWQIGFLAGGHSVTIPAGGLAGLKPEMAPLGAGDFTLEFSVEDINGNSSNTIEYKLNIRKP